MNFLEVKYEKQNSKEICFDNFVSNIINAQNSLGNKINHNNFDEKKLEKLGFIKNSSTGGYGLKKEFTFDEVKDLAFEISKLENHILIHGFIQIKVYKNKLYFWDKALIYEGIDDFEYCLKYHNKYCLKDICFISVSDTISEDVLNLINYTKRYVQPSLDYITQECVWDKKQGLKISKELVKNITDFMLKDEVLDYH